MQMGRFTFADVLKCQAGLLKEDGTPVVAQAQLDAAFRDTAPEAIQENYNSVSDSLTALKDIDSLLTTLLGSGNAPDLSLVLTEFSSIKKCLAGYMPDGAGAELTMIDGAPAAGQGSTNIGAVSPGQRISGEVQSRQDVLTMLDKICDYYARTEPASPVPISSVSPQNGGYGLYADYQ